MTAKMQIADKIKAYKYASKFSIRELAELCGVQKSAITNWMAGYTRPTIDNLATLARIFEIESVEDRLDWYESAVRPAEEDNA